MTFLLCLLTAWIDQPSTTPPPVDRDVLSIERKFYKPYRYKLWKDREKQLQTQEMLATGAEEDLRLILKIWGKSQRLAVPTSASTRPPRNYHREALLKLLDNETVAGHYGTRIEKLVKGYELLAKYVSPLEAVVMIGRIALPKEETVSKKQHRKITAYANRVLRDKQPSFPAATGRGHRVSAGALEDRIFAKEIVVAGVHVVDGDSVDLRDVFGRRYVVDFEHRANAPELNERHGRNAKTALQTILTGKSIRVQCGNAAGVACNLGRQLVILKAGGKDVADEMLRSGYAKAKRNNFGNLPLSQEFAMKRRSGIWSDSE